MVTNLICCLMILGSWGCKKREGETALSNSMNGSWRIASYFDNDENVTNAYTDDIFLFNASGSVVISGKHDISGEWLIKSDNSNPSGTNKDFVINIPAGENELLSLSKEWNLQSQSPTRVELRMINSADGTMDILTFAKVN